MAYVTFRAMQFRNTIMRGKETHEFKAHIRRDVYGPHTMKWCTVCKQGPKAWIHTPPSDKDDTKTSLLELETADIKWRFENDPEWVKVFGGEYDPKTFREIPKFHNGECGGPNDSCERCAWEADEAEAKAKEERKRREKMRYADQTYAKSSKAKLDQEECNGYEDILWTLWNTCHDPEEAKEEFDDLQDEIGMLKNNQLRQKIKELDVYKRLTWCLATPEKYWKRREEAWQNRLKQLRDRDRYSGMDYY
jgi:hypothetical protein